MRIFIFVLAALILGPAMAEAIPNLDFRGATLGMSLQDFKATPVGSKDIHCRSYAPAQGVEHMTDCDNGGPRMEPFDGFTAASFEFFKGSDGTYRLGNIQILTSSGNADTAFQALSTKFASSGNQQIGTISTQAGAEIQTKTVTWINDNGEQQATMTVPCKRIDEMCLILIDKPIMEVEKAKLKAAEQAKSSQF